MATNFVVKLPTPPCTYRSVFQKRYRITPRMCTDNSATNATTSCKILVKIGPVVLAENILMEIRPTLRVHVVVRRISSNISKCTGPIFVIFSPYESAIHPDDGSILYFPICQGTLPWQPNSLARSAHLPTGLYILPSVISFFDCRPIVSGSIAISQF